MAGEKKTLAKARMELEELYLGIPDESVNLTFQDLAEIAHVQNPLSSSSSFDRRNNNNNKNRKSSSSSPALPDPTLDPFSEQAHKPHVASPRSGDSPAMAKLPSLDFSRGLQAASHNHREHDMHNFHHHADHDHHHSISSHHNYSDMSSMAAYDQADISGGGMSMAAASSIYPNRAGRHRPGIPHSNICTICTTYIYLFRHRCLVCGRVYCRNCVNIGMGDMSEGRKCIDCLGRRFSTRYIHRAGEIGCWSRCFGYRSEVKLAELKWAEKGPRRTGRGSMMMSRSVSPMGHANPPSFVATTPSPGSYSPYSTSHHPHNHHLPF